MRLGKDSPIMALDGDLLRCIFEVSEVCAQILLDCGAPAPGCSLYGFMFDLQIAPSEQDSLIAVTALQVDGIALSSTRAL